MRLTDIVIQKVITKLITGQNYRVEILALINAEFLQYVIGFFQRIVEAKLKNESITGDWYKKEFILNPLLPTSEIIINSGLNQKTIQNIYQSSGRDVVLKVAPSHYDELFHAIKELCEHDSDIDVSLTIKFRGVSVELNISESLIVINTMGEVRITQNE
jgi:hypothetical protein